MCKIYWWSVTKEYSETKLVSLSLHLYHIYLCYFIQTLSTLYLTNNQIGDKCAKSIGEALQKNTVRENQSLFLFISVIFIFLISYRPSRNSTSPTIKSEIKVQNLLVKRYKRIQWDKTSLSFFISIMFIVLISYRPSHNSTSPPIKSEAKVHNRLVKR
jgi:hypothetical protein